MAMQIFHNKIERDKCFLAGNYEFLLLVEDASAVLTMKNEQGTLLILDWLAKGQLHLLDALFYRANKKATKEAILTKAIVQFNNNAFFKTTNAAGVSPLISAVKQGRDDWVRILLTAKADVNAEDTANQTALFWAANNGHADVVALLIAANADVNVKNNNNNTALYWAARNGHADIVALLIAAQADVNVKNKDNNTALPWAAHNRHAGIVASLIAAKINVSVDDFKEWSYYSSATPLLKKGKYVQNSLILGCIDTYIRQLANRQNSYNNFFDLGYSKHEKLEAALQLKIAIQRMNKGAEPRVINPELLPVLHNGNLFNIVREVKNLYTFDDFILPAGSQCTKVR